MRPNREPDVCLPEYMGWTTVKVWVAERVFWLNGNYFKEISSSSLELENCSDPMFYLKRVAEHGTENPRKNIARRFLESFDNILLGFE